MEEDYKEQLLNYVTGNLETTSPTTDEIFKEIIEVNRSNWIGYIPDLFTDFHFEGLIQERNSDTLILYGGYRAKNSTGIDNEVYGIIILLDNNFNPIKTFYEYDNGTKLRYIQNMQQAEDNSFYMVDDTNFAYSYNSTTPSSTKRLVILNNFATKIDGEYKLILRSSYIFPSGYSGFKCETLAKNSSQAQYVLIGNIYESGANNYQTVSEISINIPYGSSVEWNKTNIITYVSTIYGNTEGGCPAAFIKFQNDTYQVKALCRYYHNTRSGGQVTSREKSVRIYTKPFNSSTYSSTNILNNPDVLFEQLELENQAIFLSENKVYFVLDNINNTYVATWDLKIQLWEYDISTSTTTKIYENSYGTGQPAQQEQIYLSVNQGYLYIEDIKKKTSTTADYYIQRYEGIWNPKSVSENKSYQWNQRSLYVLNSYNLLKLFLFPTNPRSLTWCFPIVKEIYNPNQYNGLPYQALNSMIPKSSILYDEDDKIVFARNLYNKTISGGTTTSTVEVPNNYLNDVNISKEQLISETNSILNSETTLIEKNIYEQLYINFINTLNVIDNNSNTPVLNPNGASRINDSMSQTMDYDDTKITKFIINYSDSTSDVRNFCSKTYSSTENRVTYTCNIYVPLDKNISNIQIKSNDENTTYLTIDTSSLENGKYYRLSQDLVVE